MKIFSDDYVEIYNADSRNMFFIPGNSVHLVITSPPYNVGMNYDGQNDRKDEKEHMQMITDVFKECYRVLVSGGKIAIITPSCLNQTTYSKMGFLSVKIHNILEEIGFIPLAWINWVKLIPIKSTAWGSWKSPSCPSIRDIGDEYIIVMCKEIPKLEGDKDKIDITDKEFMQYSFNRWNIRPETSIKWHPAPFPEEIAYRLIKLYTYQNNTVLDCFSGSGTVGFVAKKLKRKAILIDISEKYCELSALRVGQGNLI